MAEGRRLSPYAGLIVLDVRTQQALWTAPAPAGPYYLSVDPQGQTAVGLGPAGAIVVNLATHAVRRVAAGTDFADGQLGRDGVAVVRMPGRMPGPRLAELNTATGTVSYFGAYPGLISVSAGTSRGPATALVFGQAGNIDLIRLPDKTVLASVPGSAVDQTAAPFGAIAPNGRQAVISGGDGQFWTFGVGETATATGIPVPAILSGVVWGVGDRLLVYSQDQRGQVYYLPRAELIGTVCTDLTRLFDVTLDYSSDVIGCKGAGRHHLLAAAVRTARQPSAR